MHDRFVAIGLYDSAVGLLKINMTTDVGELVPSKDVNNSNIAFGTAEIERNGNFVALLATPEGPLLCFKGFQYRPELDKTAFDLKDEKELSHLRILHEGIVIYHMTYAEKAGIGLHPFANCREDIDFYFWLANNFNNANLYQVYTKEIQYLN